MRELKEFKDIHKNKDIYILASGKSVDFIDNSFFENKIIIGVNQVYKKVKCQYLVRKDPHLIDTVLKNNNIIHFISNGGYGGDNNKNALHLQKYIKNNNIVIFHHNKNTHDIPEVLPENKLVVSWSTITSAIHLGAYMGAKNILLVGHDGGQINGESNFKGYHTDKTYKLAHKRGEKDYIIWLGKIEKATIKLKKILKDKYNCNIYSINPFINFNLEGHKYTR